MYRVACNHIGIADAFRFEAYFASTKRFLSDGYCIDRLPVIAKLFFKTHFPKSNMKKRNYFLQDDIHPLVMFAQFDFIVIVIWRILECILFFQLGNTDCKCKRG